MGYRPRRLQPLRQRLELFPHHHARSRANGWGEDGLAGSKLRLLYEAQPMGFITEQAGEKASTGRERILEISPPPTINEFHS